MKNTIELAAEFIRRAAFVDANTLLKDAVWRIALKTYTATLNERVSRILGLLDGMKKENNNADL